MRTRTGPNPPNTPPHTLPPQANETDPCANDFWAPDTPPTCGNITLLGLPGDLTIRSTYSPILRRFWVTGAVQGSSPFVSVAVDSVSCGVGAAVA